MDKNQLRKKFNKWLGHEFDAGNKKSLGNTHRWLFCYDGELDHDSMFDCACCLDDEESYDCGCHCHARIGEIVDFFWSELHSEVSH